MRRRAVVAILAIVSTLVMVAGPVTAASPFPGRIDLPSGWTPEGITADLNTAYDYLNSLGSLKKDHIGVIGFCWGGGQTFRFATNRRQLAGAFVFYGPPPDKDAMARIQAPRLRMNW